MWIVAALASSSAAEPLEITIEQAVELGMPRLHHAFRDCDCVGLTWSIEGEDRVIDIARADIRELRQSVAADGQHELFLVHVSGPELLLERGPCIPLDDMTRRYERTLGLIAARPGLEQPVCGDVAARVVADMKAWEEQVAERHKVTYVTQLDAVAALRVTDRRGEPSEAATAVQREWRALRPRLSHCFTLSGGEVVEAARLKLVARTDGTVAGVRMLRGGTGAEQVDGCIVDLLAAAPVTSRTRAEKLRVELTPP
jgi:hypothetical protein